MSWPGQSCQQAPAHFIARRLVRVDAAELVARELKVRRAVGHRRQVEVLLADPGEEADALVQDVIALEIVRRVRRARLERERRRERLVVEAVLPSQRGRRAARRTMTSFSMPSTALSKAWSDKWAQTSHWRILSAANCRVSAAVP